MSTINLLTVIAAICISIACSEYMQKVTFVFANVAFQM